MRAHLSWKRTKFNILRMSNSVKYMYMYMYMYIYSMHAESNAFRLNPQTTTGDSESVYK